MEESAHIPLPLAETNQPEDETQPDRDTLWQQFRDWVRTELVWYAGSFSFHLLALSLLLLVPNFGGGGDQYGGPVLESPPKEEVAKAERDRFDPFKIDSADLVSDPQPLIVDPKSPPFGQAGLDAEPKGVKPDIERARTPYGKEGTDSPGGGATGFGPGPKLAGDMSLVSGNGTDGTGPGTGFDKFRKNRRGIGETVPSERAVNAALVWLANHQLSDGSWSLQHYVDRCTDKTCSGPGDISADAGATALGLLPFLAAGQTHRGDGPYRQHVRRGIEWLLRHQQPDGNLAKGAAQMMYSHALATIALSEAYGMTGDREVGLAAQGAVNFILAAQNTADGGWRYNPKDPGDTSVVGWQIMALKSANMAGLNVGGSVFSGTSKWLDSVAVRDGVEYAYQPGQNSSPAMTSVGLLCRQYLGAKRDNPILTGGMSYLLNHMPDEGFPNIYYWYYATQVMHNMNGSEWDTWNHKIRNLLLSTQVRNTDQCANGSWPAEKDAWGRHGGRLMTTSLSTLTLEVYYRYLPLFKAGSGPD